MATHRRHTPRGRRLLAVAAVPVVQTPDLPTDPLDHVLCSSNAGAVRGVVDHFVAFGDCRTALIGGDASRDTRGADQQRGFQVPMETLIETLPDSCASCRACGASAVARAALPSLGMPGRANSP